MIFRLVEDINKSFLFEAEPEIETSESEIGDIDENLLSELYPDLQDDIDNILFKGQDKSEKGQVFTAYVLDLLDKGLGKGFYDHLRYLMIQLNADKLTVDDFEHPVINNKTLFTNNRNFTAFKYVVEAYKILHDPRQLKKYFEDFMEEYSDESDKAMYLVDNNEVKTSKEVEAMLQQWEDYQDDVDNDRVDKNDTSIDDVDIDENINNGNHTIGDIFYKITGVKPKELKKTLGFSGEGKIKATAPMDFANRISAVTDKTELHNSKLDLKLSNTLTDILTDNKLDIVLNWTYSKPIILSDVDTVKDFINTLVKAYYRRR